MSSSGGQIRNLNPPVTIVGLQDTVQFVVRAAPGQTADVVQHQDSAGNPLLRVTAAGTAFVAGRAHVGATAVDLGGALNVTTNSDRQSIIVRASAGQTASFQQWQNSAGTSMAELYIDGSIFTPVIKVAATSYLGAYLQVTNQVDLRSAIFRGSAGQTVPLFELQNSVGTQVAAGYSDGNMRVSFLDSLFANGTYLEPVTAGAMRFTGRAAAQPVVISRGAGGQTGSLQEWHDSGDTVKASIASTGQINALNGLAVTGNVGFYGTAPIARPAAYTQTFATPSRTVPNLTSNAVATTAATNVAPFGYSTGAQADAIVTAINALRTDVDNAKKALNSVIDDLQSFGLLQ